MTAKVFIDSNIWLYAFVKNPGEEFKHDRARGVMTGGEQHVISSQVIAEVCNNLLRKAGMDEAEVFPIIEDLYRSCEVRDMTLNGHRHASQLRSMHGFSFWDSLIVASALEAGCTRLLTEDMQDGQWIENQLRISNPLLKGYE